MNGSSVVTSSSGTPPCRLFHNNPRERVVREGEMTLSAKQLSVSLGSANLDMIVSESGSCRQGFDGFGDILDIFRLLFIRDNIQTTQDGTRSA